MQNPATVSRHLRSASFESRSGHWRCVRQALFANTAFAKATPDTWMNIATYISQYTFVCIADS